MWIAIIIFGAGVIVGGPVWAAFWLGMLSLNEYLDDVEHRFDRHEEP